MDTAWLRKGFLRNQRFGWLSYLAYNLTKEIAPDILKGREEFCRFIPWAREMLFIEQLDLEDKKSVELNEIELKAEIGL